MNTRIIEQPFIVIKDMALLLGLSPFSIAENEHALGLDIARRQVNQRIVMYDTAIALQQLSLRGMLPSTLTHLEIRERPQCQQS